GAQLHEGAELLEPADASVHPGADREALGRGGPRIGRERAQRESDAPAAFRVGLELHDLRLDLLAHLEDLGGGPHAAGTYRAHVDESLDPTELDERPEVPERRHRAGHDGALVQPLPGLGGLRFGLLVEKLAARDDDVPSSPLELRDAKAEPFADVGPTLDAPPVDLGAGAERPDASELHLVAALDLARHHAFHWDPVRERLLELARQVAAAARDPLQHDRAAARAVVHHGRLDLVSLLDAHRPRAGVAKLGDVDRGLGLAADGHERGRRAHRDHAAANDFAGTETLLALRGVGLAGG